MDGRAWLISFLLISPIVVEGWHSREERRLRGFKGDVHYHSKRHMLPREIQSRKRFTTIRPKEGRKKPSGHLRPLNEDDMENDEVVSVAVGPPAIRPKYEKAPKHSPRPANQLGSSPGAGIVKDVLTQLGREFLNHQVNEDFVFGQYVGNSMRNLTSDLKLKMQHEILELIVKYQKMNNGDFVPTTTAPPEESTSNVLNEIKQTNSIKEIKYNRDRDREREKEKEREREKEMDRERKNEAEEGWPDFNNLAKIVG